MITNKDIDAAHLAIAPYIHKTPVLTCESINQITGANIYFKCENFQKIGAFKMRGAMNAALRLPSNLLTNGLATHSSGNHAQAVARAAAIMGVPAYIVMPENAPEIKKTATKGYGGLITFCEPTVEARAFSLDQVVRQTGATVIHPFNDEQVIMGQGTAVKELYEQLPANTPLDFILAPIGGGGLMSGTAIYSKLKFPTTRVIGAEPQKVDDAKRSLTSGKIEHNYSTDTIADGLKTDLGPLTFDYLRKYLDDIFTVSEESIIEAMKLIWERMKIIIEPSCAVPLAVVLTNRALFKQKNVGMILTGGNVDVSNLPF
jgi:threonine dehydratase